MLHQIKRLLKLHKSLLLSLLVIPCVYIPCAFLGFFAQEDITPVVMTIMIAVFVVIFGGMLYLGKSNLALSMGITRRDFNMAYVLIQIIWVAAAYGILVLLSQLNLWVTGLVVGSENVEWTFFDWLIDWKAIPILLALVVLHMFVATMYSRFELRFIYGMGICSMAFSFLSGVVSGLFEKRGYQIDVTVPSGLLIGLGILAVLALALVSFLLAAKQRIR